MKINKKTVTNFLGINIYSEYKTENFFDKEEGKEKCKLYIRDSTSNSWSLAFILLDEESAASVGEMIIEDFCELATCRS